MALETPGQRAEYCIWLWDPQHKEVMNFLEGVQRRRAMVTIEGVEHLSCEEKLKELGLFNFEKRRFQGDFGCSL